MDVWRCLEILHAAQMSPVELDSDDGRRALEILEQDFGRRTSSGIAALAKAQGLNEVTTAERATRVRALIARLRSR